MPSWERTHDRLAPTILVVDDEPQNRKLLSALLTRDNYRVAVASSGQEALDVLDREPIDLVLLDLMMPEMDGLEVLRRVRASPSTAQVPVIVVTALSTRQQRLAALTEGAEDFLPKPIDRVELTARVRNLVRMKQAHDESARRAARLVELTDVMNAALAQQQAILSGVSDVILVASLDGTIIQANPAAYDLLDSPSGLVGRSVPEAIGSDALDDVLTAVSDGGFGTAVRLLRVREREMEARVAIAWDDDLPVGMVIALHDITELRSIDRMKDELLSTVNHELRTPLTSLRGFAELLHDRELPRDEQRKFLRVILEETDRLTALISDFLDIQKIESGLMTYAWQVLHDLPSFLSTAAKVYWPRTDQHQLRLVLEDNLPPLRADSDRLRQVLANLISNAVKFSPDGGEIVLRAVRAEDGVRISIIDKGIGIPDDALGKLFTRFFRVDNGATRRIGGSGLGLALIKEIIEAHDGFVEVESTYGKGSCFTIVLPEAGEQPQQPGDQGTSSTAS